MNILENIKPSGKEKEKLDKIVNNILNKLNSNLIAAKAIPGGSYAKDTWLKGDHDIDVFVLFNKKYDEKNISDVLWKALKKSFLRPKKKIHGSRTYYKIKKGKYIFEIVPVIEINNPEEALNIMDISPLHVDWVNENAKDLKDEIRKIKAFCKAAHCYGAESYIKGFSGYVLEILTIFYGSFDNLVKSAVKWKKKDIIDFKKRNIKILNKSKISPLIVIDPVQKERNAAAALSLEKFNLFKEYCKEYLKNKDEKFFIKEIKIPEDAIVIEVKPVKGREDIVGSKLLKVYDYIKEKLDGDFGVKESFWYWNKKVLLWYVLKEKELKQFKKHYGPSIEDEKNIERFKEKWKNYKVYEENGYVYINIKRKDTEIKPYLKSLFKDDYIKEKVKKIKIKTFPKSL